MQVERGSSEPSGERVSTPFSVDATGYLKQGLVIACFFLYLFALKFLRKYNRSQGKNFVKSFFGGIGRYIRKAYERIKEKAIEILGIKPRSSFMKGSDEKDIVIDTPKGIFEKIFSFRNRPKWKDMDTNALKVRFLYQRFVVKMCKKGYRPLAKDTPKDVYNKSEGYMKRSKEELYPLFTSYEAARYSRHPMIDDSTIEEIKKI